MEIEVQEKFASYPEHIATKLAKIRALIFTVAKAENIGDITETLKWGEPSYLTQTGSTIRFDYKAKSPDQYCVYFNCNTKLVDTFKELYADTFTYQGNRALVFSLTQSLPITELSHCLSLALRYKKIKHLPLLGA